MSPVEVWILSRAELESARAHLLAGHRVQRDAWGKPLAEDLYFSVSHSGELALMATCADAAVGVDLEAPRPVRRAGRLATRLCSDRELAHLDALGSAGFDLGLMRLWVRKEAVAKADGRGIGMLLETRVDVLDPIVSGGWLVNDLPEPGPGYLAAIACRLDG